MSCGNNNPLGNDNRNQLPPLVHALVRVGRKGKEGIVNASDLTADSTLDLELDTLEVIYSVLGAYALG